MIDALEIPQDLLLELNANKTAKQRFVALPISHKQEYLKWIEEAKEAGTRQRRIDETILRLLDKS